MNELLNVCYFYWVITTLMLKKKHDSDVFDECISDLPTDLPTNQPTNELTNQLTDQPTDQPNDQRTQPIIEMQGRI